MKGLYYVLFKRVLLALTCQASEMSRSFSGNSGFERDLGVLAMKNNAKCLRFKLTHPPEFLTATGV